MIQQLEKLTGSDRELVVIALQALHRERVSAYEVSETACHTSGKNPPGREFFGLSEISVALRRIGAAPL